MFKKRKEEGEQGAFLDCDLATRLLTNKETEASRCSRVSSCIGGVGMCHTAVFTAEEMCQDFARLSRNINWSESDSHSLCPL